MYKYPYLFRYSCMWAKAKSWQDGWRDLQRSWLTTVNWSMAKRGEHSDSISLFVITESRREDLVSLAYSGDSQTTTREESWSSPMSRFMRKCIFIWNPNGSPITKKARRGGWPRLHWRRCSNVEFLKITLRGRPNFKRFLLCFTRFVSFQRLKVFFQLLPLDITIWATCITSPAIQRTRLYLLQNLDT